MSQDEIADLLAEAEELLENCASAEEVEALRVKYLGRKSALTAILRGLKELDADKRVEVAREANLAKKKIEKWLAEAKQKVAAAPRQVTRIDHTLPGKRYPTGKLHLITRTVDDIVDIFYGMGFEVALGPEVEEEYYNFGALNFPPDHPARDMQDTFYVADDVVLRTHTSPIQVREFQKRKPPVRIIAPGRTYRQEAISARAYCVFYQLEGFYVDHRVTFADLKGVLTAFAQQYFGADVKLRFRPSFFPFTEPSAEVDISCFLCQGRGCRICKHTGWLEILGCGMIHPNVFEAVGYDAEEYTGYAFGMGIERIAMLKHKIDDIRLFYENDIRFLSQF
ncbi:MAG: phenylalanine--tRNA ligase subunit alpha [candidate division Zixibacteria bacterium]|nr:phenylalanine--tRNA ligase subunit alpha [candidate division Zixibacteria bacterium]